MIVKPSLRLRIAAVFAVVCIGVVSALGIMLYNAHEDMEEALIEQLSNEELGLLIERHRAGWRDSPAPGPHVQYHIARTDAERAALPEMLRKLAPGHSEAGIGADERHFAVRDVDGTRFIVVYDAGPHEVRELQFQKLLLFALASVAVVAVLIGYWLAGVLTRQLTDLSTRVSQLKAAAPHEPLAQPGQDQEVASLARALDDYQARMVAMIKREQEFTANASHELRTPLTEIATSCELLAADTTLSDKARSRVAFVSAAAERMAEQIQTLLFLARNQVPADSEPVALAECAEDAAQPYRSELTRKGVALEIDIGRDAVVNLNRQALQLILANLIQNAVQHTARGSVRVSYGGRKLTVADTGAGISAEHLPHVFERHYRGGQLPGGFGIGLAIVKRICEQFHWRIDIESAPSAGSAFNITFP